MLAAAPTTLKEQALHDHSGSFLRVHFKGNNDIVEPGTPEAIALNHVKMSHPPCTAMYSGDPEYFATSSGPPHEPTPTRASISGRRIACNDPWTTKGGPFTVLPFDPDLMVLTSTSGGIIPDGRRPIEGGFEKTERGRRVLYHVVAKTKNNIPFIGRIGEDWVSRVLLARTSYLDS